MGNLMSTIKANDLQNASGGIPTVKGQRLIPTAWVNFNGTGTVAIRDSENVSSITDVATGSYDVSFTVTMDNTNYSATASTVRTVSWLDGGIEIYNYQTTGFRVNNIENSAGADPAIVNVQVMGGQA